MCEFLERAGLRGTPTEEVREWSAMTHRVVELSGPFPTPDDMRVELWLHEESATRLLDMCDRIDAEFDRTKTENAKLRALCRDMFLIVACMDLDGSQLHTHGVDADWRTLRERYDELMGYEGEVDE